MSWLKNDQVMSQRAGLFNLTDRPGVTNRSLLVELRIECRSRGLNLSEGAKAMIEDLLKQGEIK
jgi:hypothetical protein